MINDLDPADLGREAPPFSSNVSHPALDGVWLYRGAFFFFFFLVFQGLLGTDPRLTFAHVKENKNEKKILLQQNRLG